MRHFMRHTFERWQYSFWKTVFICSLEMASITANANSDTVGADLNVSKWKESLSAKYFRTLVSLLCEIIWLLVLECLLLWLLWDWFVHDASWMLCALCAGPWCDSHKEDTGCLYLLAWCFPSITMFYNLWSHKQMLSLQQVYIIGFTVGRLWLHVTDQNGWEAKRASNRAHCTQVQWRLRQTEQRQTQAMSV